MAKKAKIELPIAPLAELVSWWRAQETPAVIIGGLAVSLLSRPRVTRDIDGLVLLPEDRWDEFLEAGREFGCVPRLPDTLEFAQTSRVLLLRHQTTGIDIDIILGSLPFETETVERANLVQVAGVLVPLATAEDLVIMKAVAHRPQDLLDIDALLAAFPDIDVGRIRMWMRGFADALEIPDLYSELEKRLIALSPKKRRKRKT